MNRGAGTRMVWLLVRRQRTALLLVGALVLLTVGGLVWVRAVLMSDVAAAGLLDCVAAFSAECEKRYTDSYPRSTSGAGNLWVSNWVPYGLALVCVGIGLVLGSGLHTGRPGDRGLVFTFSQAGSRWRWWGGTWLVAVVASVGVMTALSLVTEWALRPILVFQPVSRLDGWFTLTGAAPAGHLLVVVALAATFGVLLRSRTTAAVATVVVWLVLSAALMINRGDFLPGDLVVAPDFAPAPPRDGWAVEYGVLDPTGARVDYTDLRSRCPSDLGRPACQDKLGLRPFVRYQPIGNYWPLQWIETGLCVALAALLAGPGWLRARSPRRR